MQGLQRNVIAMALCCKKGGTSDYSGFWYRQNYSQWYWHYGYHGPKA